VNANSNLFTPPSIIVTSGTTVTWHNTDTEAHNVQKADDAANFGAPFGVKTPEFAPGATYSFTFTTPGTYFYTCTIHTGMNGKVQVVGLGQSVTSSTAVG
jgi:plastocyanin